MEARKRVKAAYVLIEVGGRKLYTWTIYDKGFTPILGLDVMRILGVHVDVPEQESARSIQGPEAEADPTYTWVCPAITYTLTMQFEGGRGRLKMARKKANHHTLRKSSRKSINA